MASPTEEKKEITKMFINDYENTYSSVKTACKNVEDLPALIAVMRETRKPMTCREIGISLFGDDYVKNGDYWHDSYSRQLTAHLSQMLRHLVRGGFIRWDKIDGEPVEVERPTYIRKDDCGNPQYICVHDDEGNEYQMPNPKYNPCYYSGEWVTVKETIVPKIKVYLWVAE